MLISRRHNYIYIHVYKVAGQSVKVALRKAHYPIPEKLAIPGARAVELAKTNLPRPLPTHATARQIRDWVGHERWDDTFTFSFVRNPWDWQVSLYHFIQGNKNNHQRDLVSSMTFDEYIDWRVTYDLHLQGEFVFDQQGEQLVDFVGRFENLTHDFAEVCRRIGMEADLGHENSSDHQAWKSYYSDESAAKVAEAFAPDIEAFGYSF